MTDRGWTNQSRASLMLGAKDPRWQRNMQAMIQGALKLGEGLQWDKSQRISLKPARAVADIEAGGDVEAKINEILSALRDAGVIE